MCDTLQTMAYDAMAEILDSMSNADTQAILGTDVNNIKNWTITSVRKHAFMPDTLCVTVLFQFHMTVRGFLLLPHTFHLSQKLSTQDPDWCW